MFTKWLNYQKNYPNRLLLVQDKKFPKLGRWIDKQRKLNREKKLLTHRFLKLDEANFPFHTKPKWIDSYNMLKKFHDKNGDIKLPMTNEYKKLREWVIQQRHRLKNDDLAPEKIELLNKIGL